MNKGKDRKMIYTPPKMKIARVVLEGVIAASPIQSVKVQNWEIEGFEDDPANSVDIWLDI